MKLAILLFGIVITGIITVSSPGKNISGTWILQNSDSLSSRTILRIQMGEGIWIGKIDIPQEEVYDKEVYSVKVDRDSVFIAVSKDGSVIKAAMVNDSTIAGDLLVDGRSNAIKFIKR